MRKFKRKNHILAAILAVTLLLLVAPCIASHSGQGMREVRFLLLARQSMALFALKPALGIADGLHAIPSNLPGNELSGLAQAQGLDLEEQPWAMLISACFMQLCVFLIWRFILSGSGARKRNALLLALSIGGNSPPTPCAL